MVLSKRIPMEMKEYETSKYCILEASLTSENKLVIAGPFDTVIEAKKALKKYKGIVEWPVIVRVIGTYVNYAMGNPMFSNKNGIALPDNKEMKLR